MSEARTPAVVTRGLTKEYRLYPGPGARVLEWVTRRARHRVFRALSDVSFVQHAGEGIAVVGENGAGKSTLLKLLAGVSQPSSGTMEVTGRIAAILELGAGFHPDFTGRQNIRLNAALLGLTADEIREREPGIVDERVLRGSEDACNEPRHPVVQSLCAGIKCVSKDWQRFIEVPSHSRILRALASEKESCARTALRFGRTFGQAGE